MLPPHDAPKRVVVEAVHFNRGRVYIRDILTHSQYDEEKWKE